MGVIPKVPPPRDPAKRSPSYVPWLERRMRGRSSVFGWRRRRAHAACVALIRWREDALLALDREIAEANRPHWFAHEIQVFDRSLVVGGAGCTICASSR